MNEIWTLLWRLQELDRTYAKRLKERALALGPEERQRLAAAAENAAGQEKESLDQLNKTRSSFRRIDMDLAAAEARLSQSETRLYSGEVTNAKELAQLEHRVNEERAHRSKLEEEYLALLEKVEQCERRLNDFKAEAENTRKTLLAFDQEQEKRKLENKALDHEYEMTRQSLLAQTPDQQRDKYERIHARHPGSALVRIERGSCNGCHNSLSQAEIERAVRLHGLATCENCGRLLAPETAGD